MKKHYTELHGGVGHKINFRAERYVVRRFLEHQVATIVIDELRYPIHDISMNGLSFFSQKDADWKIDTLINVSVYVANYQECSTVENGRQIYHGKALVVRTETTKNGLKIGIKLEEGFLDLPRIRWNDEEQQLTRNLDIGPPQIRDSIPNEYREIIEQAVCILQFYKRTLDRHDKRYRQDGSKGDASLEVLVKRGLASIKPHWDEIRRNAGKIMLKHMSDSDIVKAAKVYTETMLTPLFDHCPILARAYTKPMGYAGDYHTMDMIYRDEAEGPTAFDKVLHKLVNDQPITKGARNRKNQMKQWLKEEYRYHIIRFPNADFRVTNIGSGPAKEVSEFVCIEKEWHSAIHWTLVDQEEESLSQAYAEIYPPLSVSPKGSSVSCKYISFLQMLQTPGIVFCNKPQNLIYSVGLFDYLRENIAHQLIKALYEKLSPGGLLVLGNAAWPFDYFWEAEFVTDWTLIYRTRQEMLDLARPVSHSSVDINVYTEPEGAFSFLCLRKPI